VADSQVVTHPQRLTPLRPACGVLLLALAALLPGCDGPAASGRVTSVALAGDAALRERDAALPGEIDRLAARCAPDWRSRPDCLEEACRLRSREIALFAEARAYDFRDLTESNYWHRGRLKFPGNLEQLFRRLAEESPASGPPCPGLDITDDPPSRR
jgi:hypothetical protein